MINVANGNLVVQSTDVNIKERGIDLAFRRTYNSQSTHDYATSDGSTRAIFGNGWTNTFDAHIAYNAALNIISLYDVDGARYDWTSDGQGNWVAPPGLQGETLKLDGTCYYDWTKKDGRTYEFYRWNYAGASGCNGTAGQNGRIAKIWERNWNNWIRFDYYYDGAGTNASNLSQIIVTHADGQYLTLNFKNFGTFRELATIIRPDGAAVVYSYSGGKLTDVCQIGNNTTSQNPGDTVCTSNGTSGTPYIRHQYGYNSGNYQLAFVNGANWVNSNYTFGTYQNYTYDTANRITTLSDNGTVNPTISDGYSSGPIQSDRPTGVTMYFQQSFAGWGSGVTTITDTDKHSRAWTYDRIGRVTQTQEWVSANLALVNSAQWDGDNNLIAAVDERGLESDYAYDANDNTIAAALPAPIAGASRPTSLYSYDQYNNVTAYCAATYTQQLGHDWEQTGRPAPNDSLCPSGPRATRYTWNYTDSASEPYGYLTDSYSPSYGSGDSSSPGVHATLSYDYAAQGGDYGLPTAIADETDTQHDGTPLKPTVKLIYDAYGNVTCYSKLQDGQGTHWFRATYDNLNRQTATADPDDSSLVVASCANTAGLPGSRTQSTVAYFPNGQIASSQSPSANAVGVNDLFAYDADGNLVSQIVPVSGHSETTLKWYDGADRLVEVAQPTDATVSQFPNKPDLWPWLTRYFYDLSQGNGQLTLQYSTAGFLAHGKLFKTQRYLPGPTVLLAQGAAVLEPATLVKPPKKINRSLLRGPLHAVPGIYRPSPILVKISPRTSSLTDAMSASAGASSVSGQWLDVSGTAYDSLDRDIADYRYAPGTNNVVTRAKTFDGATSSLVASVSTPVGDVQNYSYDSDGRVVSVLYTTSQASSYTPNKYYTYDQDGRLASVRSNEVGTWSYTYNFDGRTASETEGSGGTGIPNLPYANSGKLTSPVTYSFAYYRNGLLASRSTSSGLNSEVDYSYRQDAAISTQYFNLANATIHKVYTPAGRLLSRSDDSGTVTQSYDTFGRLSSKTMPSGSISGLTYDGGGRMLTEQRGPVVGWANSGGSISYTATGEVSTNASITPTPGNYYFDGAPMPMYSDAEQCPDEMNVSICYFDDSIVDTRNLLIIGTAVDDDNGVVHAEGYSDIDLDGRIQDTVTVAWDQAQDGSGAWRNEVTKTEQYDAEDHLTGIGTAPMDGAPGFNHYYVWGPNGHIATMGSQVNNFYTGGQWLPWMYQGLHWDGDQLDFESEANGSLAGYQLDFDGVYLPNDSKAPGTTFFDRDVDGGVIADHNHVGHSALTPYAGEFEDGTNSSTTAYSANGTQPSFWDHGSSSVGPIVSIHRTDGITDGQAIVQGVRNYDPGTQQWSTPDAFAGDISDPMSQAKYMWNNNNGIAYSDPTGYCSAGSNTSHELTLCIDAFIQQGVVMGNYEGDNRGFNANCKNCTFRAEVQVNFSKQTGKLIPGTSHVLGVIPNLNGGAPTLVVASFKGTATGSVTVSGNTATIHMTATVGGPLSGAASLTGKNVSFDATVTIGRDGAITSFSATHSQFPSFEMYSYNGSTVKSAFQYSEQPRNQAGPLFLQP